MYDYKIFISGIEKFWLNEEATKRIVSEHDTYFQKVFDMYKRRIKDMPRILGSEMTIKLLGQFIFDLIISEFEDYKVFNEDSGIFFKIAPEAEFSSEKKYDIDDESELTERMESELAISVMLSCLFTSVCRFLRETKRYDGKTVGQFLYDNSAENYSFHFDSSQVKDESLYWEESSFRKHSEKLFSNRKGHVYRQEWSTISHDSEDEMRISWNLKHNRHDLEDIQKRMGNLYSHIHEIEKKANIDFSEEKINNAFNKTMAKIDKIKYPKFLELGKYYLDEISKDENSNYYAINLYRLERKLKLYNIATSVPYLLNNIGRSDEEIFSIKTSLLEEIPFPYLRSHLFKVENFNHLWACMRLFTEFRELFAISVLLTFEALVKEGNWGDSWLESICNFSSNLASHVLYAPSDIDFSIHEGSQDAFEKILKRPVIHWYMSKKDNFRKYKEI